MSATSTRKKRERVEPQDAQDEQSQTAQTLATSVDEASGQDGAPNQAACTDDTNAPDGTEAATTDRALRSVSDIAPSSGVSDLDRERLKQALEALIFVSERIVTAAQLARGVKSRAALVRELVAELMLEYRGRGIELIEVGNGYQFRSAHACADFVREFVAQKPVRLTRAQLETLALIAYRQPVTRPEIDEVRGVDSGSAMRVLLERNLIKMLGRKDEPGRPLLYGTSTYFLEFFSMRSLKDLPTLREFTDLSDENRVLFKRKTGESVEDAEAELAEAEEAARREDEQGGHISDEDLAALAAEADAAEDADGRSLPPAAHAESRFSAEPPAELEHTDRARRTAPGDDDLDEDDEDEDDEEDDEDDEDEDT